MDTSHACTSATQHPNLQTGLYPPVMHKLAAGSAPAADVTGLSEYTHCKALWPGSELSNGMGSGVMLAISHMIFGVGRASKRSAFPPRTALGCSGGALAQSRGD